MWLLPALRALVTLACVPSGLPGAIQNPVPPLAPKEKLARELDQAIADAKKKNDTGQFLAAIEIDRRAQQTAHRIGDLEREAKASLGLCYGRMSLERFREATGTCESTYQVALQAGDKSLAGAAANNLTGIYRNLGEYALAEKESREAMRLLQDSPRKDWVALNFLYLADLSIEQGRFSEGIAFSDHGIRAAREATLPEWEAFLWDVRGFAFMNAGQLSEAGEALRHAQAIAFDGKVNPWMSVILGHRSELEFKKGNYADALRLNDLAFASSTRYFYRVPAYYFVHVRGRILEALNRKAAALAEFQRAMDLANTWRESAPPGDSTNTQTVVYLNEVYADFAQLAAQMALERHDPELSRQALEALAQNRAASLREQLTASLVKNPHFSDRYFELLSELKAAQARVTLGQHSPQDTATLQSIRLELSELEDQSLSLSTKKENYRFQNSLKDIQARLHRSELLLSFCLGKTKSFLWAVTVDDVQLYELPKEAEIVQRAKRYSQALQNGHGDDSAGTELSRVLFGQLDRKFWQKRDWLITEDGTSAGQIPYAALTDVSISGPHQPLIAHHSLRILPSELLLLLPDTARPAQRFVGVADPIYNQADTRRAANVHFVHASDTQAGAGLGRLVGSAREIKAAAKLSGMPEEQLLSGSEANGAALKNALQKTPELLHFAVHVVSPEGKPQEAALALSLTSDNVPELLTREAVAAYRVPGSLVVLSGCASGQGKALPSAGLIGLSRAWLLAGASAVVVSSWPIPDDSGEFFSAFYIHLQKTVTGSLAQRAAIALQEAQLDMQHSSGYRNSPSFWAAYSIFSKE